MPGAYTSFYQREDLTTRLKNILDEYPPGVGPYKEFLQNADDARANRFALCLDHTAYPCERLLAPQMAEWQGPALLIWNSSSFSESDFESIAHVGQSGKYADASRIGKYGLGFNVAYHFSDVPTFVSRDQLVAFDPHERFLPESLPGLRCNFTERGDQLRDQLQPFERFHSFVQRGGDAGAGATGLDGTLFRLPLRTPALAAASLINPGTTPLTPAQLRLQLEMFAHGGAEAMLFLKHVEELCIFEQQEGAREPQLLYRAAVTADEELRAARSRQGRGGGRDDGSSSSNSSSQWSQDFLLSIRVESSLAPDSPDGGAAVAFAATQDWRVLCGEATGAEALAASLHQTQHTGVASRRRRRLSRDSGALEDAAVTKTVAGRAYCFLPLPVLTGLPVHINAAFALTSNRRDLWRHGGGGDEGATADGEDRMADAQSRDVSGGGSTEMMSSSAVKAAWNQHLLTALGVRYADLIEVEAASAEEELEEENGFERYGLWPNVEAVAVPFDVCALSALRELAGSAEGMRQRRVFFDPVSGTNKPLGDVTFIDPLFRRHCGSSNGGIHPPLTAALRAAGVLLVDPPAFVRAGLRKAGVDVALTTPRLISEALRRAAEMGLIAIGSGGGGGGGRSQEGLSQSFSTMTAAAVFAYLMDDWEEWDARRLQLLDGLPLIPLANRKLGIFRIGSGKAATAADECFFHLDSQFVGMFDAQMTARLVDSSAQMFMQMANCAAFESHTNVKRMTLAALSDNIEHVLPATWRGQESVRIGASIDNQGVCGTVADCPVKTAVVSCAFVDGEEATSSAGVAAEDEQEQGWARPGKSKKKNKQKQAKQGKKKNVVPQQPLSTPVVEPMPIVSNQVLQQRLHCFWTYIASLSRAQQLEMKDLITLSDSWPLVAVGVPQHQSICSDSSGTKDTQEDDSTFALEFCLSYGYARRRLLLRAADYSAEEARLLARLGVLFLPTESSRVLSKVSLPRRDACRSAVHSYHLCPCAGAALSGAVALELRGMLLGWQQQLLGYHRGSIADDDEGSRVLSDGDGWQRVRRTSSEHRDGLVLVSAKQLQQLPVFETFGGEFWPVDVPGYHVDIHTAVVSPSVLWDQLGEHFGAEIVLRGDHRGDDADASKASQFDDNWMIANQVTRPEEVEFFSRWLVPRLKKEEATWLTQELALALLSSCGAAQIWNDSLHGPRLMSVLRETPLVYSCSAATGSPCKISAFIDPYDSVFQHIYRDDAASAPFPPKAYADNKNAMELMRRIGCRSMSCADVFCETARAVKPHDIESGRVLVSFLAQNEQLSWSRAEWHTVLNIPFIPARTLARCSLPPRGLLAPPTELAIGSLRRRFNAKTKGGGKQRVKKAKLARLTSPMERDDDWQNPLHPTDDEEAEAPILDDIMRGQVMRTVEQLTATASQGTGGGDDGDVVLIKASQAANGGACLPQMAWTCWTNALVLDSAVDKLPYKISQSLRLQPFVPLDILLSHLATIVRTWAAEARESGSDRKQIIRLQQGAILLSMLEIHEALCRVQKRKLADQQHRCGQALRNVPICLFDDGVFLRPCDVYVDLEEDITPSTRAPPRFMQDFYYLLQTLGAPTVPTDAAPTPVITSQWQGILSEAGCQALLGIDHSFTAGGASGICALMSTRHPMADVRISFGGLDFYAHALVLASSGEVLRLLIFGLGGESPARREPCAGGPSVIPLSVCESLEGEVEPSTLAAMLLYHLRVIIIMIIIIIMMIIIIMIRTLDRLRFTF